ncbi:MAG: HD domain-containing phosphohydrolase [Planctomycetota bacterium]
MTTKSKKPRILCVDDDPNILEALGRHLRRHYSIATAIRAEAGLRMIDAQAPFEVVIADFEMPEMNGIAFLEQARRRAPDTIRILLTGQADMEAAMAAVNEGAIFRFLWKPCPVPELMKALGAAVRQHDLITSERVLLEQTLQGCIRTLTDVLALCNPAAFGRAMRVRRYVDELSARLPEDERWVLRVAAMLSQVGCVTLPSATAEKLYHGQPLTIEEQAMADHVPGAAAELLAKIPRMEEVREILRYQEKNFDGTGPPRDAVAGNDIPWGARILKIALHYDIVETQSLSEAVAIDTLLGREGMYDPEVLRDFRRRRGQPCRTRKVHEVALELLQPGMVFTEDIHTPGGVFLVARGQEATPGLIRRLRNMAPSCKLQTEFRVAVGQDASGVADEAEATIHTDTDHDTKDELTSA